MPLVSNTITRSKPAAFSDAHGFLHVLAQREVALARGERTHVHAFATDAVHADAVAQQRAAGLALARVHADHADGLRRLIDDEAADQLIHHG
jgi:hypothetical protein